MALHAIEVAQQVGGERRTVGIAEKPRKALDALPVGGQCVGLLVGDHLDAMLDAAQEFIGARQFLAHALRDPVVGGENVECHQRRPHPQFGMAPPRDQLLGLREELDLANAAATDLDVMALDRNLALATGALHLPLHVVDIGQCGEVEMLAPDERRNFREQRIAGRKIARAWPRLDHRRAFPGATLALVVVKCGLHRHRGGSRGGIGTQPQIDAEDVTVAGALLQQARDALRQTREERRSFDAFRQLALVGVVEHDQVHVAGEVQFARAHLAHREDDQAAALLRVLGIFGE
ncbi:hypothetical protein BN961_01854 [Afipia felis]|uniref:Uncharacterized protein n=1 Tax=Afipia felis TaxID=1035 RepID=A0A090MS71_AFIFE|nr:hypothetical protein BN961_01854 [Afipia felis]